MFIFLDKRQEAGRFWTESHANGGHPTSYVKAEVPTMNNINIAGMRPSKTRTTPPPWNLLKWQVLETYRPTIWFR
jgi:hypothetical protein